MLASIPLAVHGRPRRGLVVSDLHLFARRSRGAALFGALREKIAEVDVLVLNGDTFDFRWSTLGDQDTTIVAALDWLRAVATRHRQCEVHFIAGNHDCLGAFWNAALKLAADLPGLHCHECHLRIGTAVFLHGDCAEANMDDPGLKARRALWEQDRPRGIVMSSAYIAADRLGLTRRVHERAFPRQKTVQRIAYYLDRASPGWRDEVRDCYFGHTHLPFSNYRHEAVAFHNTGSAIQVPGMGFNPIFFEPPVREAGLTPVADPPDSPA